MKNNFILHYSQMIQSYRNISFNTAVKLFNCQGLSEIYIILSDNSFINLENDDQFIKYHFNQKNMVKIINPDLIVIYNKIIHKIKKLYKTGEEFVNNYKEDSELMCSEIHNEVTYPLNIITRVISDIYINNDELKKKKNIVNINSVHLNILPNYELFYYYNKMIYHIETIIIFKSKRLDTKLNKILPLLNTDNQYQIDIYNFLNYESEIINQKNLYYRKKDNKSIEESMRGLENYLWIKEMILTEMSGSCKYINISSNDSMELDIEKEI